MIDIVTAFFDIGRGSWEGSGLPSYLKRTNDQYFENFSRLCKLENKIIVYTSSNFVDRIKQIRSSNIEIIEVDDFRNLYPNLNIRIKEVLDSENFKSILKQPWNPECWSSDYILVNILKSHFVVNAIENNYSNKEFVAWIDFGYCRTNDCIKTARWDYDFEDKINFFTIKEIPSSINVIDIIANNDVYTIGSSIVCPKDKWDILKESIFQNFEKLLNLGLVDDDQLYLLLSYVDNIDDSKLNRIDAGNWFTIFTKFNKY